MGNEQSSPPSSRNGCTDPSNDCRYILYQKMDGSGWQHRTCGEVQHSEKELKETSKVKINKKGCMITLNSSENLDGNEAFLEAETDGEVFDLEKDYNFSNQTQGYITSKKAEINYESLFSSGGGSPGGLNMKMVVLGIGVVVILLYMVMKTGGNEVEKNSLELLQDIREDRKTYTSLPSPAPMTQAPSMPAVTSKVPSMPVPSVSQPVPQQILQRAPLTIARSSTRSKKK